MIRTICAALASFVLAACAAQSEPARPNPDAVSVGRELETLANDGRAIAEAQCAGCHAIGEYGASPVPEAPVFRTILTRYRADVLEEEMIQGIQVNHRMPDFQFNPQGADALIAYLRSVQQAPAN
ncbi:MAG TPA: c-type cytochrome [Verrucomicrobiae bacterium]|jgi:mono/diheme cytochrome c family protein|nr:c-type cytochrome [Verrucomicrobiae bacterium]